MSVAMLLYFCDEVRRVLEFLRYHTLIAGILNENCPFGFSWNIFFNLSFLFSCKIFDWIAMRTIYDAWKKNEEREKERMDVKNNLEVVFEAAFYASVRCRRQDSTKTQQWCQFYIKHVTIRSSLETSTYHGFNVKRAENGLFVWHGSVVTTARSFGRQNNAFGAIVDVNGSQIGAIQRIPAHHVNVGEVL